MKCAADKSPNVTKNNLSLFIAMGNRHISHGVKLAALRLYEHDVLPLRVILGHDSVMYSRSERAADTVHWHAQNVPANVGRRYMERMGRRYAERMGQPHTGIVWAECHVSSALAKGCPY